MTTRTYRSGTNKTGRDDNELVTGTSDIGALRNGGRHRRRPISVVDRKWLESVVGAWKGLETCQTLGQERDLSISSRNEKRADTYFAFTTQVHPSSGIPMPPLSYFSRNRLATRGRTRNSSYFGAAMDHSQKDVRNPYSPLMCILLLLMVSAATQFKVYANWF